MTTQATKLRAAAAAAVVIAVAGGVVATMAQGADPPTTAAFSTIPGSLYNRTAGTGTGSTNAQILTGGTVTFNNADPAEAHNLRFTQSGVSCNQTAPPGGPSGVLTIPDPWDEDEAADWAGTCTFTQPGTFTFVCDPHASEGMQGTVTVSNPSTNPPPPPPPGSPPPPPPPGGTPPPPPPPGPGGTTPPPPPPGTVPGTTGDQPSIAVSSSQRGGVRGTITRAKRSSSVKVEVTAKRGDIGATGDKSSSTGVGTLNGRTSRSGGLDFLVNLSGKAKTALAKRGRLLLGVRVTVAPLTGATQPKTFKVTLRPAKKPPKTASVALKNNLFTPSTVDVRRGGTVTWTWRDGKVPHNVKGKSFESEIKSSGTFKRTFKSKGSFAYECTLHDGMVGKVLVR